jgi:hypothetical protein
MEKLRKIISKKEKQEHVTKCSYMRREQHIATDPAREREREPVFLAGRGRRTTEEADRRQGRGLPATELQTMQKERERGGLPERDAGRREGSRREGRGLPATELRTTKRERDRGGLPESDAGRREGSRREVRGLHGGLYGCCS